MKCFLYKIVCLSFNVVYLYQFIRIIIRPLAPRKKKAPTSENAVLKNGRGIVYVINFSFLQNIKKRKENQEVYSSTYLLAVHRDQS
jgi:hypothetical protein